MKNLGPQFEVKGGILKLFEDDEVNFWAIKSPATLAADLTFTAPNAYPSADGYLMAGTTVGVMSWFNLFGTENTWTVRQIFSQPSSSDPAIRTSVDGDSQRRFDLYVNGQLNWGSGSATTDTLLFRSAVGRLQIRNNLEVFGLTVGRVVAASTDGLLVSLPAPAADGYVLSSTVAGVQSWVVNGAAAAANLSVGSGIAISAGSGTNALLVALTLAIDTTAALTWTALETFSSAKVYAGTSADRVRVGGNLYTDYTDRLDNAGSGTETDLSTFTVKDNTLTANGDSLYFSFAGTEGGSGLTKVTKVYVDGVSIYSFTTALTGDWFISLTLVRETSSNLKFSIVRTSVLGGTAFSEILNGDAAFTGDSIVKLTHTTTLTGATPYCTEYFMLCDYMPSA